MDLAAFCRTADNSLGPVVPPTCRGGFDFTLLFEQTVLSILPCVIFLLLTLLRAVVLHRASPVIRIDAIYSLKLAVAALYAVLQLAALVSWSLPATSRSSASIPSAILSLMSAMVMCALSYYEHTRAFKPSTLLLAFLNVTAIFDVAIARTLWLSIGEQWISAVFTAGLISKVSLLVLEAREKSSLLMPEKRPPLEALSSIYSRIFFWWINPLFRKGLRSILTLEDLADLEKDLSSDALAAKISKSWKRDISAGKWALFRALVSALKIPLLAPAPARLALIIFTYAQPFLINVAVGYVQGTANEEADNIGYGLIGATLIVYLGISASTAMYNYKLYRVITMIRGSLISIIYEKTLRMPSADNKSPGAALTLMSSDVDRIAFSTASAFDVWFSALETAIALYLLERQIGWACIAPVLLGIIGLAGNSVVSKLVPSRLKQWQQAIQQRVASTSKLLRNMRSVKMMGLASEMADSVQEARVYELQHSSRFRWCLAFMNLYGSLAQLLSAPFVFLIFIYTARFSKEGGISAARAFTTLSLLELMTTPLGKVLRAIPVFTVAIGCLDRIQDYLRLETPTEEIACMLSTEGVRARDSQVTESILLSPRAQMSSRSLGPALILDGVSFRYEDESTPVLKDVNMTVNDGELVMVIGPVGCGKTTLLKTLVGDLVVGQGSLRRKYSEIAYCQQESWLTNKTVRKNIIGPAFIEEDDAWYKTIISICALDEDIARWPEGDETVIGTGGVTCSGGQRQRLALARALYSRKSLLVLDDVLSALDAQTERFIFAALFSEEGLIKRSKMTVVLVTNNIRHLPMADSIVILNVDGRIDYQGSYDTLQDSSLATTLESFVKADAADADDPGVRSKVETRTPVPKITEVTAAQQEKTRRTGDLRSYAIYGQSMGWSRATIFLFISVGFAFCSKFSQVWLQWFTGRALINRALFIGVYFGFALSTVSLSLASFWWMMIIIIPVSAGSLHQQLVTAVFRAPLGFFSSVDLGVILNRFSQDMQFATLQLPVSTQNALTTVLVLLAQFALIATGSSYLTSCAPFLVAVLWLIQKYYLRTSRQLRLLDLEQKSPLYTSFTETIEGLSTIRAFGWTTHFHQIFLARLDDSQRPVYFLYCIQRWLNMVLDLIVTALATLLMVLATQLRATTAGGLLGLAMVGIVGFSQNLGQFIFFYTELETSLGAIARIKEYTTGLLPDDEPAPDLQQLPPADWPSRGQIEFKAVTAHYNSLDEPVLRDVSIQVPGGRIVGISGRTGSGKSSLILAALRLLNPSSGTILIDDIDISTLSGEFLRSKITTIPQDPYLPSDRSLRLSLNGSGVENQPDSELINALEKVGLLHHVVSHLGISTCGNNGSGNTQGIEVTASQLDDAATSKLLDAKMERLPLSAGQLQLFCLAHTLLQQNKRIVLLDEVTSALDYATEDKLRAILKDGLRDRTVLMIAHRPEILGMCDMVVRMENGAVL